MRPLLLILTTFALLLASAGAATSAGDRETVVPPPEVVAENFMRHVVEKRFEPAMQHAEPKPTREQLELLQSQLSGVDEVGGEERSIHGDDAVATVRLRRPESEELLQIVLIWDQNSWKVVWRGSEAEFLLRGRRLQACATRDTREPAPHAGE